MIEIEFKSGPVEYQPPPPLEEGGGECVFLGRTRREEHEEFGRLQSLHYEAYESMARSLLESLAREAVARHDALAVRIHHTIGTVPVGEASVFIQVVCGHRNEAFIACRMLIDRLKQEVPIWKKEIWEHGSTWSPGAAVPDPESRRRS